MPSQFTRRRSFAVGTLGLTGLLLSPASGANAGRGVFGAIPNVEFVTSLQLAIPDFLATTPRLQQTALDISRAIRPLLKASGPLHLVDNDDVNTRRVVLNDVPQPADWQSAYIAALVVGEVSELTATPMQVAFRLWHVAAQQQVVGQSYKAEIADWERVARIIAGEIFMRTSEG